MTVPRATRPRRRRRRRWPLYLLGAFGIAVVFLAGVGLGQALHDNPDTGGTQTVFRTLHPLPLVPVAHNTVTVTVTTS
jgi:hypothetical protein